MNILKSGWNTVLGPKETVQSPSAAETIERLVERLETSTLLDDRRDAVRTLRSLAKSFRLEIGAHAMQPLLTAMEQDCDDNELVGHALDTIALVLGDAQAEPDLNQASAAGSGDSGSDEHDPLGEQFAEIFVHRNEHVWLLIELLAEREFRVRWPAERLLLTLLRRRLRETQDAILHKNSGIARLIDLLSDAREVIRNDAILLLLQLTRGHTIIQKIVAFENAFDRLFDIVAGEGNADGGVVVEDCLLVIQNLLRHNASNQALFREGGYANRLLPLLQLSTNEEWSGQREANVLFTLHVLRALVAPGANPTACQAAQRHLTKCGVFDALCELVLAAGISSELLRDTLLTLGDTLRGHSEGQQRLQRLQTPPPQSQPLLLVLMLLLVNERQAFLLRVSAFYLFECFLRRNPLGQAQILEPLLNRLSAESDEANQPSVGQLLCGALFAIEPLTQWFAAISLSHTLVDSPEHKQRLLCVQLAADQSLNRFDSEDFKGLKKVPDQQLTNKTSEPPNGEADASKSDRKLDEQQKSGHDSATGSSARPLLAHVCSLLQQSAKVQTRIALLQFLATWLSHCPPAVAAFLQQPTNVPFLAAQAALVEGDESEQLFQSLCAFVLALCVRFNDNQIPGSTADDLRGLVGKRVGLDAFVDKLGGVAAHDAYGACVQRPQIRAKRVDELLLDHEFCRLYRSLENELQNAVKPPSSDAFQAEAAEALLDRYKQLIRDQDEQMTQLRSQLHAIGSSHTANQAELVELRSLCQQLKDQQALMKATDVSSDLPYSSSGGCNNPQHSALAERIRHLEADIGKYKSAQLNEIDQIILNLQQYRNLDFAASQFQRLQQEQFQRLPVELQMHIYYQQNQTSSTNNSINGNSQSLQYAQEQPNVANLPSSCSAHTLSVSALPPQQPESQSLVQQYVQTPYYNSPDYNTNHVSSSTFSVANTSITPYVPSGVAANTTTTTTCTIISSYPTLDNHLGGTTSDLSSMSSLQASPQHYETVAQAPSSQYDSTSTTIMMTNGSHSNYVTPIPDCDSLHTVETKLERLHLQSEPSHLQSHQPSSFVASTFSNDPAVNVSSYYAQN